MSSQYSNPSPLCFTCLGGWPVQALDLIVLGYGLILASATKIVFAGRWTGTSVLELDIPVKSLFVALICLCIWHTILKTCWVYDEERRLAFSQYFSCCVTGLVCCMLSVIIAEHFGAVQTLAGGARIVQIASTIVLFISLRLLLVGFDTTIRPRLKTTKNILIVGTGVRAADVFQELEGSRRYNYNLVGYVDSDPQTQHVPGERVIGSIEELEHILMTRVIDEVLIALPMKSQYEAIGKVVATCEQLGIESQYFTDHFGTSVTKKRRPAGDKTRRMALEAVHRDMRCHFKRVIDIVVALLAIVVFLPLLLLTAISIKLTSPGPILFSQERFGLNKRKFSMLKFRSMVVNAEAQQSTLEHLNETSGPAFKIAKDPRVTPFGRFIRKMSIDELPQLINVLMGHMSLVGPRPLPVRDVGRFSEAWLMRRFSVKPGLTCLWQVSGRSNTDFDRWIELDLQYIDGWSLSLDTKILLRTVPAVLKGRGAS